jgi:hypothetical protein
MYRDPEEVRRTREHLQEMYAEVARRKAEGTWDKPYTGKTETAEERLARMEAHH